MSRAQIQGDAIVVTGLGMSSSLGDAHTACAATRAGVSMGRETRFSVLTSEDEEVSVIGHSVPSAAGFRGVGKLLCLAVPAVHDLLSRTEIDDRQMDRTGLCLCLPEPTTWSQRHAEPTPEGAAPAIPSCGSTLGARLSQLTPLGIPEQNREYFDMGQAGLVHAIRRAANRLSAGAWQRCVVGAIDSLLDEWTLQWLLRAGRLKTPDKPDGLQPGEAGVFLLLERYDHARRRGASVISVIGETAIAVGEPGRPIEDGAALSQAVGPIADGPESAAGGDRWLISDHNGEERRARELACMLVRFSARHPGFAATRWLPAASFGDTGAASAAVALCLASRAFARGYAPGPAAVIVASSDDGGRACIRIHSPPLS